MTLQAHLKEARNRLFVIISAFVLFSILAYTAYDRVVGALLLPLHGRKLMHLNPAGGFSFIMTVTLWAGFAATLPLILYNVYQFVAPTLPGKVRSRGPVVLVASCFLFAAGALFGYVYAIPGALHFLMGIGDQYVQAMITADAYLNFTLLYTVGLGILFQIPIIMMLIHWIKPLKPGGLLRFERYVILIAFIVGALLSPSPDALNQTIIAAPFIAMYQVGLIGVMISTWRHRDKTPHKKPKQIVADRVAPTVTPLQAGVIASTPVATTLPTTVKSVARIRSMDGVTRTRPSTVRVPQRTVRPLARPVAQRRSMDVFASGSQNA